MSNTILDHPVARSTDPITSFEAGEGTNARQISHSTVFFACFSRMVRRRRGTSLRTLTS